MMSKELSEVLKLIDTFVTKTDEYNRRLITVIIALVLIFVVSITVMVSVYLLKAYD